MCGIAGIMKGSAGDGASLRRSATAMNDALHHRGPNHAGVWLDAPGRVALASARLSIQDLSSEANQPMVSESGRYVLVYNGELYNVDEMRRRLGRPQQSFRTHSDTEVLLAAVEALGLAQALRMASGMFALGLWDCHKKSLSLARDRLGKKPLHVLRETDRLLFASEIKAILCVCQQPLPLDPEALHAYFELTYIPAPMSIFQGLMKVRPGRIMEFSEDLKPRETSYWSLEETIQAAAQQQPERKPAAAARQVEELLEDSTRRRLISDVPVGVLLSGGVDSSLVSCMLARRLQTQLETFTIGFEDPRLDESRQASAIAQVLRVPHTVLTLSVSEAMALVDPIFDFLDEPFGDYSAIPTYAVCRLARSRVTVLVSGDGGDEVFGGYSRYLWAAGGRRLLAEVYARLRSSRLKLSPLEIALEIYRRLMTRGADGGSMPARRLQQLAGLGEPPALNLVNILRRLDFSLYLPDDILVKADRMSMANSVELRSPFLDDRLVEISWSLAQSDLVAGGTRRPLTRGLFVKEFGAGLLQPRKYGFGLPVASWLLGPLRPQVEEAIVEIAKREDIRAVTPQAPKMWQALQRGQERMAHPMWLVYAFWRWTQRWEKTVRDRGSVLTAHE